MSEHDRVLSKEVCLPNPERQYSLAVASQYVQGEFALNTPLSRSSHILRRSLLHMDLPPACFACRTPFEKASAKFCRKCGVKRSAGVQAAATAPASARGAPPPAPTLTHASAPVTTSASSPLLPGGVASCPPPAATVVPSESTAPVAFSSPTPVPSDYTIVSSCLVQCGLQSFFSAFVQAGLNDSGIAYVEEEDLSEIGLHVGFQRRRLLDAFSKAASGNMKSAGAQTGQPLHFKPHELIAVSREIYN